MDLVPISALPTLTGHVRAGLLAGLLIAASGLTLLAEPSAQPVDPGAAPALTTTIVYLTKDYQEPPPLSLVDKEVKDKGIQGARIALDEDNRTGRLIGQHYDLLEALLPADGKPADKAKELLAAGPQHHRRRP